MLLAAALAAVITFGQPVLPPLQWSEFADHAPRIDITKREGLAGSLGELEQINVDVNAKIVAVPGPIPGAVPWRIYPARGWCGDYVVTKRHELLKRHWPSSSLLIAVVGLPNGAAHAILLVHFRNRWLALDSLTSRLMDSAALNYKPISIQGAENPNNWYALPEFPR